MKVLFWKVENEKKPMRQAKGWIQSRRGLYSNGLWTKNGPARATQGAASWEKRGLKKSWKKSRARPASQGPARGLGLGLGLGLGMGRPPEFPIGFFFPNSKFRARPGPPGAARLWGRRMGRAIGITPQMNPCQCQASRSTKVPMKAWPASGSTFC